VTGQAQLAALSKLKPAKDLRARLSKIPFEENLIRHELVRPEDLSRETRISLVLSSKRAANGNHVFHLK
jgi:hypothetical protein